MNSYFPEIKKNFGFGCMRMKMNGKEVDLEEFTKMVDAFLAAGFNYFDTAHVYIDGQSETALRSCLTSRYPREAYVLTDKLSESCFKTEADIRPLFETQLAACGVDYFDFYLMHAQGSRNYDHYQQCHAYEVAQTLKQEGKIHHLGISFHDTAAFLDRILTEHPEIEIVQLQFNYADFEDPKIQSRKCYEVCRSHGKPVIVMEPVKGGKLVNLPEEAANILDSLHGGSHASYAIRFAAGFEGIAMVLSGMGSMEMMEDNIGYMADFQPLSPAEQEAVAKACAIYRGQDLIACTECRYCVPGCPMQIEIPAFFKRENNKRTIRAWAGDSSISGGTPADCVGCGQCEEICPQHLPIRELLAKIAQAG